MALTEDSDESLMDAVKKGNHQAFSILVRRHTDRFYKMAFRLCSNAQEAEDMVQDAFLKIWKNPAIWKSEMGAKFTTWFYRILINQNIDRMRSRKVVGVRDEYLNSFADHRVLQDQKMTMTQEQEMVERAFQSLPERQRTAITLCFYEGLSNKDAAQIMGLSVKGLESLLVRGKNGLKEFIGAYESPISMKGVRDGTTG